MLTLKRRKDYSIIDNLKNNPQQFEFVQAVRVIECHYTHNFCTHDVNPYDILNVNTPAHLEVIRFTTAQNLAFPDTEIRFSEQTDIKNNTKWLLNVSFMGLTGPSGVLPYHYSELVNERTKHKDHALSVFFDYFNHHTISLFYQASIKYNYPLEFERRNKHIDSGNDNFTKALLSLSGLGTNHRQSTLKELVAAYYSGYFSHSIRSKHGLKSILSDYFKVNIEIQEFISQWLPIDNSALTHLTSRFSHKGQNCQLGVNSILGTKSRHLQSKINILIGPIDYADINKFSPKSSNIRQLIEITKLYIGLTVDFDILLQVNFPNEPDPIKLTNKNSAMLGWNTWLNTQNPAQPKTRQMETIKIITPA